MRKPAFAYEKTKMQISFVVIAFLADQPLCFHYLDRTIPLLSKSEISSLLPFPVDIQPGLCLTW